MSAPCKRCNSNMYDFGLFCDCYTVTEKEYINNLCAENERLKENNKLYLEQLDVAIAWHEGDDCQHARLDNEIARLKEAVEEAKIIIYPIAAVGYKGFKKTTIKKTMIELCGEWYEKFGYGGNE